MLTDCVQVPNLCDICKKKDHLVHFHIPPIDHFIGICYECRVKMLSQFLKTTEIEKIEAVYNNCVEATKQ